MFLKNQTQKPQKLISEKYSLRPFASSEFMKTLEK